MFAIQHGFEKGFHFLKVRMCDRGYKRELCPCLVQGGSNCLQQSLVTKRFAEKSEGSLL
jgi:hypothetical protein